MYLLKQSGSNDQWSQRGLNPLKHANNGNWILARNQYLKMGRLSFEKGQLHQALNLFLYVCILDLNGAQDQADLPEHSPRKTYNFNTDAAFLAPDVVEELRLIAEVAGVTTDDLKTCCSRIASAKFLPVPAQKSWSVLSLTLQGKIDLNDQPSCFMQIQERINEQNIALFARSIIQTIFCFLKCIMTIISFIFIGGRRGKRRQSNEMSKTTMTELRSPQNVREVFF